MTKTSQRKTGLHMTAEGILGTLLLCLFLVLLPARFAGCRRCNDTDLGHNIHNLPPPPQLLMLVLVPVLVLVLVLVPLPVLVPKLVPVLVLVRKLVLGMQKGLFQGTQRLHSLCSQTVWS